jgi:hypothetical protein
MLFNAPLKEKTEIAPENFQTELLNLHCQTYLDQTVSETKLRDVFLQGRVSK